MIVEACLFHKQIPIELRKIIQQYYITPLDDISIHNAVKHWCLPPTHPFFQPAITQTFLRYGHISEWNTSKITNCYLLFHNQIFFNDSIEHWDVSRVTNMSGMFTGAKRFNQPLNRWNVSAVTSLHSMFAQAHSFNQPLHDWNVQRVIQMNYLFSDALAFNQPLHTWNVQRVQYMSSMFYNAASFNQPIAQTWCIEKVKVMTYMFYNATSFFQSIEEWDLDRIEVGESLKSVQFIKTACMFNDLTFAGWYQWWLKSHKKIIAWIKHSCITCIIVIVVGIVWNYYFSSESSSESSSTIENTRSLL